VAEGPLAVGQLHVGGDADVFEEQGGGAAVAARQGAHRENHLPDIVDQGQVVVEQDAAEEDGISVIAAEGQVGGGVDEQAPGLRLALRRPRHLDPGPGGKAGAEAGQLFRIEALVGRYRQSGQHLAHDKGAGQAGAGHGGGAGGDDLAVLGGDDEIVQARRFGPHVEHLAQGRVVAAVGLEQLGQAFGEGLLQHLLAGAVADLLQIVAGADQMGVGIGLQQFVETLAAHHQHGHDHRQGDEHGHQAQHHQADVQGAAPGPLPAGKEVWVQGHVGHRGDGRAAAGVR